MTREFLTAMNTPAKDTNNHTYKLAKSRAIVLVVHSYPGCCAYSSEYMTNPRTIQQMAIAPIPKDALRFFTTMYIPSDGMMNETNDPNTRYTAPIAVWLLSPGVKTNPNINMTVKFASAIFPIKQIMNPPRFGNKDFVINFRSKCLF